MCSLSALKCPLCAQTNFPNIDALRMSLIKAANGPLACPICHELFLGLDKLTIHLFSHTTIMMTEASKDLLTSDIKRSEQEIKKVAAKSEKQLETEDPVRISPNTEIKRTNNERKTKKKTRQIIDDKILTVQNESSNAVYNPQTNNSQSSITVKPLDSKLSTCDICEFTFRDEELRDMHFRLVHQNISHISSELAVNSSLSSEAEFKCHLCSKTFKMKGSLRVHLKVVHLMCLSNSGNSPKLSICDRIRHKENKVAATTNKSIPTVTSLKVENTTAPIVQPLATQSLKQHTLALTANPPQAVPQMPNGFAFGTLTLLPAPTVAANPTGSLLNLNNNGELLRTVNGAPLNSNVLLVINTNSSAVHTAETGTTLAGGAVVSNVLANGGVDILEQQSRNNAENNKLWKCDECSKTFTTKYFLKKHKRLHTGEMPYTCEICARTFTFQQSYHKHLLYHSNEKPHVCSTCGRAFKELSTLHNHERIHSGEKPFKCEVCGKCFRQRVSFLVHTRIHTGIMPYKCEVCQKSFRYKVSQRTHKCQPSQCCPDEVEDTKLENDTGTITDKHTLDHTTDDISESFIKEFLENTNVNINEAQNSPASAEIAAINAANDGSGNVDEALLTKAIDDIVVESCNKMGIGNQSTGGQNLTPSHMRTVEDLPPLTCSDDCHSPTQKLQNMRLYSPQLVESVSEYVSESVDNMYRRFLMDESEDNML